MPSSLAVSLIDELKAEKATAQASLPKLGLAPERQDPAAVLDQVPDLSERLHDVDDATKRALFDAFDLRIVYDKASDPLPDQRHADRNRRHHAPHQPLSRCAEKLRGWDSNPQPFG